MIIQLIYYFEEKHFILRLWIIGYYCCHTRALQSAYNTGREVVTPVLKMRKLSPKKVKKIFPRPHSLSPRAKSYGWVSNINLSSAYTISLYVLFCILYLFKQTTCQTKGRIEEATDPLYLATWDWKDPKKLIKYIKKQS